MIATNFFRALASFFTDVLFIPYDALRFIDASWWIKNSFNWILFGITSFLFLYWLLQLQKFKKAGTE